MRDWFWKIEEIRQGPDYIFIATFAEEDAENLARLVQQHLPPNFVEDNQSIKPEWRGNSHHYHLYLDRHTYQRLQTMRENNTQENIWYYAEIEVCDHELKLSNILAAGNYGETPLLAALASSSELTLKNWKVVYAGYTVGDVASGSSASSLREYLQLDA